MNIEDMIVWLETHDKLAGWAQFLGAMLALVVTYFTAFAPIWRRKRQLRKAGERLLAHGYEAVESYHRTSAFFMPFPLSVRQAALTIGAVADDISRFPVYELDGQGSMSLARRLTAMSAQCSVVRHFLENVAADYEGRVVTEEDRDILREFLAERVKFAAALIQGIAMQRPDPTDFIENPDPITD